MNAKQIIALVIIALISLIALIAYKSNDESGSSDDRMGQVLGAGLALVILGGTALILFCVEIFLILK